MSSSRKTVFRYRAGSLRRDQDELAVEEPLEIRVDTRPVVVTMRTPGHDDELTAGFLFTEGLIRGRSELDSIRRNARNRAGNSMDAFLAPNTRADVSRLTRRGFAMSSCGLCGKESIRDVRRRLKPVTSAVTVSGQLLAQLPGTLRAAQPTFERTGGLHAAGLFTCQGELVVAREDIGRHNAVDKVIGFGLLHDLLPFDRHVLVVSGRASFEILQKSLAARIPILCAVSAPSSLAVDFARESRQTLVGFAREGRMNIYTGVRRITARTDHRKPAALGAQGR